MNPLLHWNVVVVVVVCGDGSGGGCRGAGGKDFVAVVSLVSVVAANVTDVWILLKSGIFTSTIAFIFGKVSSSSLSVPVPVPSDGGSAPLSESFVSDLRFPTFVFTSTVFLVFASAACFRQRAVFDSVANLRKVGFLEEDSSLKA